MTESRITKRRVLLTLDAIVAALSPDGRVQFSSEEDERVIPNTAIRIMDADFEALGQPEVITVTIEPGDLLNVETDAWPFQPGDVVLDSGEDADHTAWLEAAPERTVVSDCDGDEWTRKNDGLWWMNRGRAVRAKSSDLNEQVGPLTVVSIGGAS